MWHVSVLGTLGWLSNVTEVNLTWWNFAPLAHGEVKLFMDCGNTLNLSAFIKVVSWLASAKQSAADLSMKHWESLHLRNEKERKAIWNQWNMRSSEDEEWQNDPKTWASRYENLWWKDILRGVAFTPIASQFSQASALQRRLVFDKQFSMKTLLGLHIWGRNWEMTSMTQWHLSDQCSFFFVCLVSFCKNLHFHRIAPLGMCESNCRDFGESPNTIQRQFCVGSVAVFEGFCSHHAALSKKSNFSDMMFVYMVISLFPYSVCITKLHFAVSNHQDQAIEMLGNRLQISLSLLFAVDVCIEPFWHFVRFHAADSQQLGRIRSVYTFVRGHWRTVWPCAWLKIGFASGYAVKDWGGRTCRLLKTMKRYIILGRTVYLTQHQAAVSFPQPLAQRQRSGKDKRSPDLWNSCRKQSCQHPGIDWG